MNRSHIRLDLNENVFSNSKVYSEVVEKSLTEIHKYPNGKEDELIRLIAQKYNLDHERILLTQGVDEAVDRIVNCFSGYKFFTISPSFNGFDERLSAFGCSNEKIYLDASFAIPCNDFRRIDSNSFIFIANPNNPTGHLFTNNEISQLNESAGGVFLDETYIEFSNSRSYLGSEIYKGFVFHSFSKSYALAGLRAGFLWGPKQDIAKMRCKQWYCNLDILTLNILSHVVREQNYRPSIANTIRERDFMINELLKLGINVLPSEANFYLVQDAHKNLFNYLYRNGIVVKEADALGMPGFVRISVGTRVVNRELLRLCREFVAEPVISCAVGCMASQLNAVEA